MEYPVPEQQKEEYQCENNEEPTRKLECQICGVLFDSSKSLDVHLHYHKENLMSKWGAAPSGSEDNNNIKKNQRPAPQQLDCNEYQPLFDYSENSAFQRIPRQSNRYHPYGNERIPQQVPCDKYGFLNDSNSHVEQEPIAHSYFNFRDDQQAEILDLDSHKLVYQPQGDEASWLDRRYFKEENGNQSPEFNNASNASSTTSPPMNAEVQSYYEAPPVMHLNASHLTQFSNMQKGSGGGAWKSNEPRRPKTYNCTACNKWFTSSGHLKRHYNTTLHKNAVKQSGVIDPALMPMSSHHHPPPQEEKFQLPQQEPTVPQEDYQDFFQYPNGMPPHITNFTDPLPSFSQIQSALNGYSNVGGLLAVNAMPEYAVVAPPSVSPSTSASPPAVVIPPADQPAAHRCEQCDKTFNKACYLTQHNKSFHSGDKNFKCARCGKRFSLEIELAEHTAKHAGEKPHKCEFCPKQFNHKTDLRRHMCHHEGIKPYICEFCDKGFIRKDHMLKHQETHKKKAQGSSNKKIDLGPYNMKMDPGSSNYKNMDLSPSAYNKIDLSPSAYNKLDLSPSAFSKLSLNQTNYNNNSIDYGPSTSNSRTGMNPFQ